MASPTWTKADPASSPPACHGALLAADSPRGQLILWGGTTEDHRDDGVFSVEGKRTWGWNGDNWSMLAVDGPRSGFAGAAAGTGFGVLAFGGFDSRRMRALDETWVWTGGQWQQVRSRHSPPARTFAAMALDEQSETVVPFGGGQDTLGLQAVGDTWIWDGDDWAERALADGPSPRSCAAMYFDEDARSIVLAGGRSGMDGQVDTWRWDGTNWTRQHAPNVPVRIEGGAVYHSAARTAVRFGGRGGLMGALDPSTWTCRSGSWTGEVLDPSPTPRMRPALAYHRESERVVLFGGYERDPLGDTWLLQP